uniref:Uncharacterized protein n=1 Tax=viral metagenome TaxID=1070528 RepID=A0A6C0H512_9ZZZZ
MEDLNKELKELYQKMSEIKKEINKLEMKNMEIKIKEKEEKDVMELEKMHEYIKINKVYFGKIELERLSHAMSAYDIDTYKYELCNVLSNKGEINNICFPKNEIENKLYPYVVKYLEEYLPIKYKIDRDFEEDNYILTTENNAPINFNKYGSKNIYVFLYYYSKI